MSKKLLNVANHIIEQLKQENADLIFKNALQDLSIQSLQDENAELMLKIAMLEVSTNV